MRRCQSADCAATATMSDTQSIVAGIPIPSTSPIFLGAVAVHVALGLICVVTGLLAMLSVKRRGNHSNLGTIYHWCLLAVALTAAGLAFVRWAEDAHLFVLGVLSFGSAHLGRTALRKRWSNWPYFHVSGMGASYILLLTAFYVDNGKNLPLWRELPQVAFWVLPSAIGVPIIAYVLRTHPLVARRGA